VSPWAASPWVSPMRRGGTDVAIVIAPHDSSSPLIPHGDVDGPHSVTEFSDNAAISHGEHPKKKFFGAPRELSGFVVNLSASRVCLHTYVVTPTLRFASPLETRRRTLSFKSTGVHHPFRLPRQ